MGMRVLACCGWQEVTLPSLVGPYSMWAMKGQQWTPGEGKADVMGSCSYPEHRLTANAFLCF